MGPGDIRVALHASSLNYHDYIVCLGGIPTPAGRIPMSDGAGVVTEVGSTVTEFKVGDAVVSTFFPDWIGGDMTLEKLAKVPGDRCDGYARDEVVAPATAFTHVPKGYGHAEAATLTCAALTAWRALYCEASLHGRRNRAGAGHRRRLDLRAAIRQGGRRHRHRHLVVALPSSTGWQRSVPII